MYESYKIVYTWQCERCGQFFTAETPEKLILTSKNHADSHQDAVSYRSGIVEGVIPPKDDEYYFVQLARGIVERAGVDPTKIVAYSNLVKAIYKVWRNYTGKTAENEVENIKGQKKWASLDKDLVEEITAKITEEMGR